MSAEIQVHGLSYWKAMLTVVVLVLTAIGLILGGGGAVATKLWGLTPLERHESDVQRIERKLDCVLFSYPRNCRDFLRPLPLQPRDPNA